MATNIVTSDGKDLDSRYLAIGGKAVSAGYADSAGSATNVTNKGSIVRNGNPVFVTLWGNNSKAWTAPSNGILHCATGFTFGKSTFGNERNMVFANKGDKFWIPGGSAELQAKATFSPVKIS